MPADPVGTDDRMWQATTENISSGIRYRVFADSAPLPYRAFIELLRGDDEFTDWYTDLLVSSGLDAFYWELPPVTRKSFEQDAEFVLIDAPVLATLQPEPAPFREYFDAAPDDNVLVFPNLGGDALLVVPRPLGAVGAYPHLAAFLRRGPALQVRELWRRAAETVYQNVTSTPRWLSTAGLGVAWLHVRLDTRPKYYSHMPYTDHP